MVGLPLPRKICAAPSRTKNSLLISGNLLDAPRNSFRQEKSGAEKALSRAKALLQALLFYFD